MQEIGLVTFHAAYNFGSMLQALATQTTIDNITGKGSCVIVNYRLKEQKLFYNHLYRTHYGLRTFLKDLNQAPVWKERRKRSGRFEAFLQSYMGLTQELQEPEDVYSTWSNYELMVSGSDQIWNRHACELNRCSWDYVEPYLLNGFAGKKISYASSIGSMSATEVDSLIPYLSSYDSIAVREDYANNELSKRLNREISTVLDPTLLLGSEEWLDKLSLQRNPNYRDALFYYSLDGLKPLKARIPAMIAIAKARGLNRIICVTPFARMASPNSSIEMRHDFGPLEFVEAIAGCGAVITDSYHGTVFSIIFQKDFYSIIRDTQVEYRKIEILDKLGLSSRMIPQSKLIDGHFDMDYLRNDEVEASHSLLAHHRSLSIDYLKRAITYNHR